MNARNYWFGAALIVGLAGTGWLLFAQSDRTASKIKHQHLDADLIAAAAGTKATTTPDGAVRLSWPRTDISVKVDQMTMKPFAGLGTWAAFCQGEHGAMLMGDTVVLQDEVTPAIDAAFANGLDVTGLHNHFFFDEPKVFFMHIGGTGDPQKLASGVKAVWDAIKKFRSAHPNPLTSFSGTSPREGTVNAATIEEIVEHKSESQSGVVKVTIGREATMHGMKFGGSMGLTTWAAFSGSDDLAAMDGDFAMTAEEVQPVLRSLRQGNLHIVALHNHMIGEQPAIYFVHFWGKGKASELATAFKDALAVQTKANGLALRN